MFGKSKTQKLMERIAAQPDVFKTLIRYGKHSPGEFTAWVIWRCDDEYVPDTAATGATPEKALERLWKMVR